VQADPVVVVTEGKTAQLFVGDKKTIILQTEDSSYSNQSETVEAGISLKVTPRVYSDYLELAINQKVSGIEQEEKDRILVKTREFDSVVRLAAGNTMMIAGLTEKQSKSAEQKTPLLGDIPIVRFFFKEKKSEQFDSQMLIFLTAEVLN
jgi:type II secretory pathway component GspD/PulD (secretin)